MRNKFWFFLRNMLLTLLFAVIVAVFILIITNSLNEKMGKAGVLLGLACGAFVLLGILLFLNKKQLGQTEKRKGQKVENQKKK